jgi:hypothetical protein
MAAKLLKLLVLIPLLALIVLAVFIAYSALNPKYTITGKFVDAYSKDPVSGVTVAAGGKRATSDKSGHYELSGVSKDSSVSVTASKAYVRTGMKVDYASAKSTSWNKKQVTDNVTLHITTAEKEARLRKDADGIYSAFKFGRWSDVYDAMTADSKTRISKDDYTAEMKKNTESLTITNYKVGDVKFLDSWTSDINKQVFHDVAQADITITAQVLGITQDVNQAAHFVKEGGHWKWFYNPSS